MGVRAPPECACAGDRLQADGYLPSASHFPPPPPAPPPPPPLPPPPEATPHPASLVSSEPDRRRRARRVMGEIARCCRKLAHSPRGAPSVARYLWQTLRPECPQRSLLSLAKTCRPKGDAAAARSANCSPDHCAFVARRHQNKHANNRPPC